MRETAAELLEAWAPACERIEIAGSVRRGKPDPHDIEIVAIPRREILVAERDMFTDSQITTSERNLLDEMLGEWLADDRLRHRLDKNGRPSWGARFKRVTLWPSGPALDIFSVLPPAQWGVILAIRTGPADFSHALVTSRLEGGFLPFGFQVKEGSLWVSGHAAPVPLETPQEDDLFREMGLPCWPPSERSVGRLLDWKREQRGCG